jgi:hypothetical protein
MALEYIGGFVWIKKVWGGENGVFEAAGAYEAS